MKGLRKKRIMEDGVELNCRENGFAEKRRLWLGLALCNNYHSMVIIMIYSRLLMEAPKSFGIYCHIKKKSDKLAQFN
ncbi:hypothetical protein VNO77_33098 [Canavalia gladiata]|uniref:Uncharacterized protein n=1 Tax=Canavalia gladiata TaxID=3824 RepID=A0AAN9KEB0_CANGL